MTTHRGKLTGLLPSLPLLAILVVSLAMESQPQHPAASRPAVASADDLPMPPELFINKLQTHLRSGSPEQKQRALEYVQAFRSIRLIPDAIEAVADTTPLPRDGDTGWGFVGHQAASVLGRLAHCFDGITIEKRGLREFSFHNDMYKGGEKLKASGRLDDVRKNWRAWWDTNRKCAG